MPPTATVSVERVVAPTPAREVFEGDDSFPGHQPCRERSGLLLRRIRQLLPLTGNLVARFLATGGCISLGGCLWAPALSVGEFFASPFVPAEISVFATPQGAVIVAPPPVLGEVSSEGGSGPSSTSGPVGLGFEPLDATLGDRQPDSGEILFIGAKVHILLSSAQSWLIPEE